MTWLLLQWWGTFLVWLPMFAVWMIGWAVLGRRVFGVQNGDKAWLSRFWRSVMRRVWPV